MKYIALFLLSSFAVGLILAFPENHNAVADLSDGGVDVNAISNSGAGDASATSETSQLRPSRHLLKKLFYSQPHVVVQPIVVQPHHSYYSGYNPYVGAGRGFGGYGGFGYNRRY